MNSLYVDYVNTKDSLIAMLIKDIMTSSFESLSPGDSLQKVAGLSRKTRLVSLPVTKDDGPLIGIMTKANLYDAVAQGMLPEMPIHCGYNVSGEENKKTILKRV
jgi:Mg/Co/Ni transporter MgtE